MSGVGSIGGRVEKIWNMKLQIFQIDAFASRPFEGNPAAVVPLEMWLPDEVMLKIAMENNLAETAFFVPGVAGYDLRWFTPAVEMDLCGHATLATGFLLFETLGANDDVLRFQIGRASCRERA